MKFTPLDERAVSTVIGFLLIFSAVVSVTGYLVAAKGRVAQQRAEGLVDVMDKAQQRQGQLVGLSYSNKADINGDGSEDLSVYLSSYGWQDITVENHPNQSAKKAVWVNGDAVRKDDFAIDNPLTDSAEDWNIILGKGGKNYVAVRIKNLGDYASVDADNYTFTFLTKTDIVFSWEVHP